MKKNIKFFFMILFLMFCSNIFCEQEIQMQYFIEGNTAYGQKKYTEAIEYYQKALELGKTVPLLFNLANAYAQNHEIGLAILNYKRALANAPYNADILANLIFLGQQESIADFPPAFAQSIVTYLTHTAWFYIAVALFWLLLFLIAGMYYYWFKRKYIACAIAITLVGFIFSTYTTLLTARLASRAIVISETVLKLAPASKSEELTELLPGQEVELLSQYQDYAHIRLGNQVEGWVQKNAIEQIMPTM